MEMQYLYVSWKDKLPTGAINVYRVDGNISFENGKAKFKLLRDGNDVAIDISQLSTIGISGNDKRILKYLKDTDE